jgi:hypothetical protein
MWPKVLKDIALRPEIVKGKSVLTCRNAGHPAGQSDLPYQGTVIIREGG